MKNIHLQTDNNIWYRFSIFYSREDWEKLISFILSFYESKRSFIDHFSFYFSEERGQHIQVVFSTEINESTYEFESDINSAFHNFLEAFPSSSPTEPFEYGNHLWCNYPNNSLIWNRFEFHPVEEVTSSAFIQSTCLMTVLLMDGDTSKDSFFSIGLFYAVQLLKRRNGNVINIVEGGIKNLHIQYGHCDLFENLNVTEDKKNEISNILETIDVYNNMDAKDMESPEIYSGWVETIEEVTDRMPFGSLLNVICKHLSLGFLHKSLMLYCLKRWYESKVPITEI